MLEEFISLWDIRDDQRAQSNHTAVQSNNTAVQSNNTAVQSNNTVVQSNGRQSSTQKKQTTNKQLITPMKEHMKGVIYKNTTHEGGSPSVEEKEKSTTDYPEFQSFYRYDDDETDGAGKSCCDTS